MRHIVRSLLGWFERLVTPTGPVADVDPPAATLAFFWHFARQSRGVLATLLVLGLFTAGFDLLIPVCIGRIAGLVASHAPDTLLRDEGGLLAWMLVLVLAARPAAFIAEFLLTNQAINPAFANRVRWQAHYHVVRQSWTFFQNDFAGRIANRVMQTGPALRDVLVVAVDAVWYIIIYGGSAIVLLAATDWRLAVPIAVWFALYAALLRTVVPMLRQRSRRNSEARSLLTGRVVDSYTNILTVKLFARAEQEDRFVRDSIEAHTEAFQAQTRAITVMTAGLHHHWRRRAIDLAAVGPGSRVLDVATGTGDLAIAPAGRGAEVVGSDFSEGMLDRARVKAPQLR